jgi:hypothetical protein
LLIFANQDGDGEIGVAVSTALIVSVLATQDGEIALPRDLDNLDRLVAASGRSWPRWPVATHDGNGGIALPGNLNYLIAVSRRSWLRWPVGLPLRMVMMRSLFLEISIISSP